MLYPRQYCHAHQSRSREPKCEQDGKEQMRLGYCLGERFVEMHLRSDGSAALLVVGKADLDEAAEVSDLVTKSIMTRECALVIFCVCA